MIEGPFLPLVALAAPLLLALVAALPPVRARALWLLPAAPLPALALAAVGATEPVTFAPDLLLGASLGLDARRALFLGFAAAIWTAAGVYAVAYLRDTAKPAVFTAFWCLTLAGNLGVFLALDVATFYVSFAAVSLAAYGLVVHDGTEKALRAGRLYLALAVLGETCLLAGFLIALSDAPSAAIADLRDAVAASPLRDTAVALLVAGFGLKAGLMPLHMWLPLAHPAAPTPASAALSGAIVKAGAFGLIAFLPAELVGLGQALLIAGLASAYAAVLLGLTQKDPKAVLAYSTISQMGLVVAVIGAGAAAVDPAAALDAATFYSLHHGLAKGALFLVVGVAAAAGGRQARACLVAAGVVALSVAGLPGTGGAAAKAVLKAAMAPDWAVIAVTLSGTGTALILGRFLLLLRAKGGDRDAWPGSGIVLPAAALAAGALALPWLLMPGATGLARGYPFQAAAVFDALWPLALAAVIGAAALWLKPRVPAVPEGDLAVPLERAAGWIASAARRLPEPRPPGLRADPRAGDVARKAEAALARWPAAGVVLVVLVLALALAAATAG